MGSKNLVILKTHINLCFANDFVYENVVWALASLWVFFCNYVLHSLGLILRHIFRFQVEDRKNECFVLVPTSDESKRNQFEGSEIDGFTQELANLLFPSVENFHVASDEREGEIDFSVPLKIDDESNMHQHVGRRKEETEFSVLKKNDSEKDKEETDCSVSKEEEFEKQVEGKKREGEAEFSVLMEKDPLKHKESKKREEGEEMEGFIRENDTIIDENEAERSISMEGDSNFSQDNRFKVEEEKRKDLFSSDSIGDSDLLEEPKIFTFSFRQNFTVSNASIYAFSSAENIATKELSSHNLKEDLVAQEETEESVQEQRTLTNNSTCGGDSRDEDYVLHDESLPSDSESSINKIDDSMVTHQIHSSTNSFEVFDSESLKDERYKDREETQFSSESKVSQSVKFDLDEGKEEEEGSSYYEEETCRHHSMEKIKETMWEDNDLDEWDCEEEDEDEEEDEFEFEWENDEFVEQMRLELKNARQGGLATILEEGEEDEERESPKVVVEDLKPLKIEEKVEFKDHIVEIQKVYRCYAEKIRKLDVLNYQTMHAIGLIQLKDPLKLMLPLKSTVQSAKPLISHNLWPRKASKQISDPILKFVHELQRDLELVYVGQVCLSWEILCWQHKKVQELKQYDSQWPRRYNLVAGEFQLFQVYMQRFLEDEPFQGPRIETYVKNRCVIRTLLQVPAIKDDNTKDKKKIKWGEEDAINSERLAQIFEESMRVFWDFVRADKDYGNVILKGSPQTEIDVKDPAISDLLGNVRTQLQKKERKLKDIVRSGNCIVRKFQKQNEDQIQLNHEQLLAQVGLRLVSRVVHMKKLRKDQIIWCNEKLNRIKFVGRKVQVDPSFSLFPC